MTAPPNELLLIISWYANRVFGRIEGKSVLPFYCDPTKVGRAAVSQVGIRKGSESALFKLFVSLMMYQARRDVVIQAQQKSWKAKDSDHLLSLSKIRSRIAESRCPHLKTDATFETACTIVRRQGVVTCDHNHLECPVRDASQVWGRMSDLGILPVSAIRRIWIKSNLIIILQEAGSIHDPIQRIEWVISKFSAVHRVGRKLATMFVSTLSTPALAKDLSPWHPLLNGNLAVVIDTHAKRAIDHFRVGGIDSYQSRVDWVRNVALRIDLSKFREDWPSYSPRLIQQALYMFSSKSNRRAWRDPCSEAVCAGCPSALCPWKNISATVS